MAPSLLSLFRNRIRLQVYEPDSFELLQRLACPHCWRFTAAWLGHPSGWASCVACEGRFKVHLGEA